VERLEEEGEEGMVHSLLSGLPELYDGDEIPLEEELTEVKIEGGVEEGNEQQSEGQARTGTETEMESKETISLANGDEPAVPMVTVPTPELKLESWEFDSTLSLSARRDVLHDFLPTEKVLEQPERASQHDPVSIEDETEDETNLPTPPSPAPIIL
jgi:hypothetical protein